MSNNNYKIEMWPTDSLTLPSRHFTPAIKVTMLLLEIMTPLGSPVVPLVYIIVQMSVFFFTGSSKCLSDPCTRQMEQNET